MTSRLLPLLLLGVLGCSGHTEAPSPQNDLRQALHRPQALNNAEALVELLREQGKEIDAYLGFPGHSGSYAMAPKSSIAITVHGKRCSLIFLQLTSITIPGDIAERFVLLDASGQVVDVVTIIWPSRLEDRFAVEFSGDAADGGLLRVLDTQAGEFWGNFDPPYCVLGEMTKKESPRIPLSWRGERLLGAIGIEHDRFVAVKR